MENEKIEYISTDQLEQFRDHPFKLRNGEEKEKLMESIRVQGTIEPLIVRPLSDGKYEVVSGHRRLDACKELHIERLPVIIKDLSDEQAVCMMVDSNLHREQLLPSEKAFAYRMKPEALSHQGTSCQVGTKFRSDERIAKNANDSARQVQRYIRLTYLIPELLQKVDDGQIALTPAVELSYLPQQEQQDLLAEMEYNDCTPSLSQAQRLKNFSKEGRLSRDVFYAVMSEEKPNQQERLRIPTDRIRKYFPASYTTTQMEEMVVKLCEAYYRKRNRDRDSR